MPTGGLTAKLAIHGGDPVRTDPLPLEFPGIHHMGREEEDAVLAVLRARSPFRFYGMDLRREAAAFEREFAAFIGVNHAVGVSSGTGALHVALGALGVGPGQEVIVPAYSWVSIIAAVVNRGAIPVLADINQSFCLDPADVARCITPRTSGIVLVHMSGAPGNAPALRDLARERNLFLVEDCAQCAGGSIDGRKTGTFGDMAIFSFQMNKNMTSGEGGCVVTNDLNLYRRAVACHDLGYPRNDEGRMMFDLPDLQLWGMGYRLDELRAAVLRVQLTKLPRIVDAMRQSKRRIRAALESFPSITLRTLIDPAGDTGCFLITTYQDNPTALKVRDALRAEGIRTAPQGVSNIVMTDWGLHLYYNNLSLLKRASIDPNGFPWSHPDNREHTAEAATAGSGSQQQTSPDNRDHPQRAATERSGFELPLHPLNRERRERVPISATPNYAKGLCPTADTLFERSILIAIPSCLTQQDEDDIILAFRKVLSALDAGTL